MSTKNLFVFSLVTMVAYIMRMEYSSEHQNGPGDDLNLDDFHMFKPTKTSAKNSIKMTSTKQSG